MYRHIDGQTDSQTDRHHADRQTFRQINTQTIRQMDKWICTKIIRQTHRQASR